MDFDTLMKTDKPEHFAAAVENITTRRKALQLDIQKYIVAVAHRWQETGDGRPAVERINMLINKQVTGEGLRRNALLDYIVANLGLTFVTEGDNKNTFILAKAKPTAFVLADLVKQENHWYNAIPEKEYVPMDLNIMLKVMLTKATKRADTAKAEDNVPKSRIEALAALHKAWEAEDAEADAKAAVAVDDLEDECAH